MSWFSFLVAKVSVSFWGVIFRHSFSLDVAATLRSICVIIIIIVIIVIIVMYDAVGLRYSTS